MDNNKIDSIVQNIQDNDVIMVDSTLPLTKSSEIEMMEIDNENDVIELKRTVSGRFVISEYTMKDNFNISYEPTKDSNYSMTNELNKLMESSTKQSNEINQINQSNEILIDSYIDEEISSYHGLYNTKELFQIACINYGELFSCFNELYNFILSKSEFDGTYYRFKIIKEDHRVIIVMRDIKSIADTVYKYHQLKYI